MINFYKTVLDSGLRIITAPMKETKAVTILFLVKAGSRHESQKQNGIFHFMEHMIFKGTKKRPRAIDISRQLDGIGADFNAFTSEEYTGFYITSASDKFNLSLDILSDIFLNSMFPSPEIEKEKGVILEEINMYKDLPQRYVMELAKKQMFGNTPLGRSTLGTSQTVSSFSRKDFIDVFKKNYCAKNTLVVVAGNQEKLNWESAIKQKLSKITQGEVAKPQKNIKIQNSPVINTYYKKTDQSHLVLGFPTFSRLDKRRYPLKLLNNIFGANMSSRLFTEIREKRGLAYYIGSSIAEFADTGMHFAYAGVDNKRIDEAIKVILSEYQKIISKGLLQEEIKRSKDNIKGRTYIDLESSSSIADYLAEQELLYDEITQPEEHLKKIFSLQNQDLKKLANEFIKLNSLNLTILGPFKDNNRFEKIVNAW